MSLGGQGQLPLQPLVIGKADLDRAVDLIVAALDEAGPFLGIETAPQHGVIVAERSRPDGLDVLHPLTREPRMRLIEERTRLLF